MEQKSIGFHAENFRRKSRYAMVFIVLIALALLVMIININTGNVDISVGRILKIVFTHSGTVEEMNIIWKIRMPRIITAAVLGGALALAGFLLQHLF